jgi:uncharacterized protein
MDITPLVPKGRQIIHAYGDGGFRISGTRYQGSVWVLPDITLPWPDGRVDLLDAESLQALTQPTAAQVEILLIGTGPKMLPLPAAFRRICSTRGIAVEQMDTGAACRTYNVLLIEERSVAAALIAV